MKRSPLTLITGGVVALIFATMLFTFQVRLTEVAIVTTLGQYAGDRTQPGLYLRWPWPIQSIYRFDNRIRNFEKKYEQTTTRDGRILMIEVFIGWRVANSKMFLERFGGDVARAEQILEGLLRDAKNSTVGRHPLGDFISVNEKELKFDQIEREMLETVKTKAAASGLEIALLGVKQIGLPESVTAKVFERMKAEREQLVKQFKGEGDAEAIRIRSEADRERQRILDEAEAQATVSKGQAEAEATKYLETFKQDPELAIFLLKLNAVEQSLKERTTLLLDSRVPPFDLFKGESALPANQEPVKR
jgi:membrane protease subunit HflC